MVSGVVVWIRRAAWPLFLLASPVRAEPSGSDASSTEAPVETAPVTKPAPPPAAIVPPRAEFTEGPLYPEGAHGDAAVVVELTVLRDGTVDKLEVVSGEEPFASPALAAAAKFRFTPATRDGVPVPARVRVELRFHEPEVAPPEPATTPGAPSPTPGGTVAPVPPPEPAEVIVHGIRPEAPKTTLTRAEVREIPGTFGDPFRAVEVLPGVTPLFSGVPYFYVRGAPPGNVGYFLDGIRVPLLYHFALGPSVIHPGLVDRVDLYAGGYPARYGRFAGGVVAAETRPPMDRWHGEANIRLFDAGALLEAPFLDGKGAALVAGRYSYTGGVLSLVAPEVTLAYWDYQVRTSFELGKHDTVSLFGFGAYDLFTVEEPADEPGEQPSDEGVSTQFHRADLRWDHEFGPDTHARTAATLGWERSGNETTSDLQIGSEDRLFAGRFELEHRVNDDALVRAGADVTVDDIVASLRQNTLDADGDEADLARTLPTRTDVAAGVRGDVILGLGRGVTVTPGLRVDMYHSEGETRLAVEPRVAARFDLSRTISIEHALGIVHQPPSFVIPLPGFELADLRGGLQKGIQSAAGVEWRLPDEWVSKATLFQAAYFNLSDLLSLVQYGDELDDIGPTTRTLGHAYGLELMLRRPLTKKFGGYFAYTLSRSTRSVGRLHHVASFDRTHVLHAAAAYDLGWRWRAGTRATFYTGNPSQVRVGNRYASAGGGAPDGGSGAGPDAGPMPMPGPVVVEEPPVKHRRARPFYRLDVRFEKRWPRGQNGAWISFVVEVLNATLTKEVVSYECDSVACREETIGPVTIPSIGLEGAF
jgi:TonB family protein